MASSAHCCDHQSDLMVTIRARSACGTLVVVTDNAWYVSVAKVETEEIDDSIREIDDSVTLGTTEHSAT